MIRPPLDLPDPGKPVAEMTGDERLAYLRQLRRALREDEVRHGRRVPQTMRETEIWLAGRRQRDLRPGPRERRGRRPNLGRAEPFERLPMAQALEAESERDRAARGGEDPE